MGAGYSVSILVTLALVYLPDGLQLWQTLAAFNVLAVLLLLLSLRQPPAMQPETKERCAASGVPRPLLGAAALVIVAGILRLPGLDYAEFQDDEVSVIWHSAEAIQGPRRRTLHPRQRAGRDSAHNGRLLIR